MSPAPAFISVGGVVAVVALVIVARRLSCVVESQFLTELRPDKYSYVSLLNAYGRICKSYKRALRAEGALFKMMDQHGLPMPDR